MSDVFTILICWTLIGQFVLIFYLVGKGSTSDWEFFRAMLVCTGPLGMVLLSVMWVISLIVKGVKRLTTPNLDTKQE